MPPKLGRRKRILRLPFSLELSPPALCPRFSIRRAIESVFFGHLSPLSQIAACPLRGQTSTCQFRRRETTRAVKRDINTRETRKVSPLQAHMVTRPLSPIPREATPMTENRREHSKLDLTVRDPRSISSMIDASLKPGSGLSIALSNATVGVSLDRIGDW